MLTKTPAVRLSKAIDRAEEQLRKDLVCGELIGSNAAYTRAFNAFSELRKELQKAWGEDELPTSD